MTTKQTLVISVRDRGVTSLLARKGIAIPAEFKLALDEVDASKLQPIFDEIIALVSQLAEMLKMSETENSDMSAKMADMPSVEEAQAKVEEMTAKLAEAQAEAEAAKAAMAEQKTADEELLKKATDSLAVAEAELVPVRAQQLIDLRKQAVAFGLSQDSADKCVDAAALKRAFVMHAAPTDVLTGAPIDYARVSDSDVGSTFNGAWASSAKALAATAKPETPPAEKPYTPGAGLRAVPSPVADTADPKVEAPAKPVRATGSIL